MLKIDICNKSVKKCRHSKSMLRNSIFAAAALLLLTAGTASADGDFFGSVKLDATYNYPNFPDYNNMNISADVLYDKSGSHGKAWGTFSYFRPGDANLAPYTVYANVTCVGKPPGNKFTIAGPIVKQSGTLYAPGSYIVFEFDVGGAQVHGYPVANLAAAKAACDTPLGVYSGVFLQGYFVAQ
jgi:hypothetical protein